MTSLEDIPLVSTEWLETNLGEATLVIAESDAKVGTYSTGRIPGAVRLHWHEDLQQTGLDPVVDQASFEQLMSKLGVSRETHIVVYGDSDNQFAERAARYLKLCGHRDVSLLAGGSDAWIEEGRATSTEYMLRDATNYGAEPIVSTT